jgi:hypothetical protein
MIGGSKALGATFPSWNLLVVFETDGLETEGNKQIIKTYSSAAKRRKAGPRF